MPYHAVTTQCISECGDEYVKVDVIFTPDDTFNDSELGKAIAEFVSGMASGFAGENPSRNMRLLDADWDTIPF